MDFDWLLVPVAYLIGGFPTARVIGRLVGHDPTEEGSGNPGATNMFRIAGKRAGLATLIFDVAKALSVTLAGRFIDGVTLAVFCGCAAVLGHMFPLIRPGGGKGGKGVACFVGLTIGAWPVLVPVGTIAWVGPAVISGRSFIGAMVGIPVVIVGLVVIGRPWSEVIVTTFVGLIIVARHHENIAALLRGS